MKYLRKFTNEAAYESATLNYPSVSLIGDTREIKYDPIPYVDLGLSVKWAKYNVGASSIGEYGNYYAWGEIQTKTDYSWETYAFGPSSYSKYGTDGKTVLEAIDDIATQTYGSNYRMPTKAELEELLELPNKWTNVNGVNGRLFCKTNEPGVIKGDFSIAEEGLYLYDENSPEPDNEYGSYNILDDFRPIILEYQTKEEVNAMMTTYYTRSYGYEGTVDVDTMLFKDEAHTVSAVAGTDYTFGSFPSFNPSSMLFIPAAGRFQGSSHDNISFGCSLWSSSLTSNFDPYSFYLGFTLNDVYVRGTQRCLGHPVRPVLDIN